MGCSSSTGLTKRRTSSSSTLVEKALRRKTLAVITSRTEANSGACTLDRLYGSGAPFAVDIGGSLAKLVCVQRIRDPHALERKKSTPDLAVSRRPSSSRLLVDGGERPIRLAFHRFPSTDACLEYIRAEFREQLGHGAPLAVNATGGGALKYEQQFEELGRNVQLKKRSEMMALVTGLNFLLLHFYEEEVFTFTSPDRGPEPVRSNMRRVFPYLLCNIGSGTSILKVTGMDEAFERVGGSTIGGGTYLGLSKLLTKLETYEQISEVEKKGRVASVDLLVRDIYGDKRAKSLGLSPDIIASSFGKVAVISQNLEHSNEDICRSLLVMICNTLAQIAVLTARIEGIKHVYFSGGFLREKANVWTKLQHAVDFWSGGEMNAKFIVHDSYLGSIGALLADADNEEASEAIAAEKTSTSSLNAQVGMQI